MQAQVAAQVAAPAQDDPPPQNEIQQQQGGRIADTPVGEVGQRQEREAAKGVVPLARIANRVQNRVQSRVRNRIDRNYDPQANATSPFAVAEAQTRKSPRSR